MESAKRYETINNHFSELENEILKDIERSENNQTFNSLYYKTKTIDLIKDAIINSKNNIYATQILYRSLIEHYLLAYYIFLKWKIDSSDCIGEDYYDSYSNSEFLKQETYSIQLEDIKNDIPKTVDINVLKQKYSELSGLTQQDLQNYHTVANQFRDVKNKIGIFLIKNKKYESKLSGVNEATFELLENYNFLSSYVHGGPYAERETLYPERENNEIKEYKNIVDWAYTLAGLIKIFLVLSLTKEYNDKYSESFRIMYK